MKTFQSTPITFIDQTDSRKLEVYITSNLPTVQIYNQNKAESEAYTPDWTEGDDKLTLSMDVFLDSRAMTTAEYNSTTIKWYKNGTEMSDGSIEDISGDKRKIIIKDNILKDNAIITYTCEATYQGIVASTRITFTRVDTGLNGQKGADGTSVRILGTAKSATLVAGTSYHTIVYDTGAIVAAKLGDAYVLKDASSDLDGHLFVCALLNGGQDGATDYFIDAGQIQGPAGDPAKIITLIGSAQVFKVGKDGKTITPKAITVTAHTVNIDNNSGIKWWYKYDTDVTWTEITNKIIQDTNSKTIISINNSNDVATVNVEHLNSRTSIALRATYESAEDALTLYKVFDGVDGEQGDPGKDAPITFLSNEHISFVADANGNVGAQTVYTSVIGYEGTVRKKPTIDKDVLNITNAGLEVIGMKVEIDQEATDKTDKDTGEVILKVSVASEVNGKPNNLGSTLSNSDSFTIPVTSPASVALQLNWTKVNAGPEGEPGVGIDHIDIDYGSSKTSDVKVEDIEWSDTIPVVPEGEYLWTRTTINYTDSKKQDTVTYTYAKQGSKGDTGTFVDDVDIQYVAGSNATTPPSTGWSPAIVETTTDKQYLWTKTIFKLSDGTAGEPVYSVAKQGADGSNFRTFTTEYQAAQNNIDDWSRMESTEWDVNESTSGTRVGDTVMIRCYNTTKQGYSYILATVISVPSDKKIHAKSTGLLDKGDPGTGASLVDVTPSALYFKSSTGSAGPFEPQYIYLYPRFQNATYSNWQYSLDGGTTWKNVISGSDWLLIGTFNSIPNALRIERGSKLYTNDITSISFKCNSTTAGVYDTVSIAKIYDVADLQIGGRNLLKNNNLKGHGCKFENLESVYNGIPTFQITAHTNDVGNNFGFTLINPIEIAGGTYTMSYWYKFTKFQAATGVLGYLRVQYSDGTGEQFNASIPSQPTYADNLNKWFKVEHTFTTNPAKTATSITHFYFYKDNALLDDSAIISYPKLEVGNTSSDWSPAPEDLIEEAANVNVMLSNEAHFFEATAGGVPIDTSVTLDVVGYKGSVKSSTTVGTIAGIPSAGMTATIINNNTTNTKLTIAVTSALTSDIADYGILTIPITVNGHTINKIFNWTKAKAGDVGASGSDAVTFQVYSNNGYALSTSVPTLTLQTFAYVGDVEIKAGATYQWYRHNNTDWVAVSGATNDYFNVSRDDVAFSNNYMCKMQFGGAEYVGVVTIEDKNDENKVFASKPYNYFAGDLWIVGTDYTPPSYTVGTMLRAEHTNTGYIDSDWVPATKYDDEIKDLRNTVDSYKQYFSVNSTNGLQIGNSSINNDILTTDTVDAANINADSASLESLDIIGKYSGSTMLQAPVINLGKFSIVIESNGSLSIVANT